MSGMLSAEQAFLAMFRFLEAEYGIGKSDDIGVLLGALFIAPDGQPSDPAMLGQWRVSVEAALAGQVDNRRMSPNGVAF